MHSLSQFKSASTFDGVAALYKTLKPWSEGFEYGVKDKENAKIENAAQALSLSPHMKRYITLRPVEHGYAVRYHNTDVITWTRRRTQAGACLDFVTGRGFSSISTAKLADDFTPSNLRFNMHLDDGYFVRVAQAERAPLAWYWDDNETARCYEFSHEITFEVRGSMGMPYEHTTKTAFVDVRSPMMRVALTKTRYFDFLAYARARLTMDDRPIRFEDMTSSCSHGAALLLLADPNKWDQILLSKEFFNTKTNYSNIARLDMVAEFLRGAIYEAHKAVNVRQVEWYPWSQFENQRRLRAKYQWAVY